MAGLAYPVQLLWAISVIEQLIVFGLILYEGNFRTLPFFTCYISLNLCQALFLYLLYSRVGFSWPSAALFAWISQATILLFKTLATTELLRLVLKPFRGIWGLGWRLLAFTSSLVVAFALIDTAGNREWALMELDRGYNLVFATAIVACLLLLHYYSIPVQRGYKALLGGFCLYSCLVVLVNTVLKEVLFHKYSDFEPLWQGATLLSFAVVLLIWAKALSKPILVDNAQPALFSAQVYEQVSPEINQNLRRLNEQLIRFWKVEASRQ
jgi:hypothetical protein